MRCPVLRWRMLSHRPEIARTACGTEIPSAGAPGRGAVACQQVMPAISRRVRCPVTRHWY
eukprot:2601915-Rhodomonas_salina.2